MPIRLALFWALLFIPSDSAFAQTANDFLNLFGGMMQQAMRQSAKSEWRRLSPAELSCLDQELQNQGGSVDALIDRGVMPSDPRLSQLRSNCRVQLGQQSTPPVTALPSPYVVDGLALYGHVRLESPAYQQYLCNPSEKFPGFTWCHKEKTERTNRGEVTSSNSILHNQNGEAVYVNRYIEPAFFGPNDVRSEIDRLSAKFGETAREFRMPQREGLPNAVIAVWGSIQLEPLNGSDVSIVAAGGSAKGLLVSFLGDLQRSAKAGVPVYRLAGSAGFLWAATFNESGRGVLRFLTIDASQISPSVEIATNVQPQSPTMTPSLLPPQPEVEQSDQEGQRTITDARQGTTCVAALPGPGYRADGSKYIITPQAFDAATDVDNKIKSLYGDKATIVDWLVLKRLLSTKEELAKFIEQVGIPRQTQNGPCDNFLVSMNGHLRLGNGLWLFLARHDSNVPNNWNVLDSIDNHTIDLGRWSWKSQALVAIPNDIGAPPPSLGSSAGAQTESANRADDEFTKRAHEAEAAKRAADEEAKRQIAEAEVAKAAAEDEAQRKTAETEAYKRQIEEQQKQQKLILIASAIAIAVVVLIASIFIVRLRRRRTVIANPVGVSPPTVQNIKEEEVAVTEIASSAYRAAAEKADEQRAEAVKALAENAAWMKETVAQRAADTSASMKEGLAKVSKIKASAQNALAEKGLALKAAAEKGAEARAVAIDIAAEKSVTLRGSSPVKAAAVVDQLARFAELRANGTLTEKEFTEIKTSLSGPPAEQSSRNDYIKQLRLLRDEGDITEEEFQSKVLASLSDTSQG